MSRPWVEVWREVVLEAAVKEREQPHLLVRRLGGRAGMLWRGQLLPKEEMLREVAQIAGREARELCFELHAEREARRERQSLTWIRGHAERERAMELLRAGVAAEEVCRVTKVSMSSLRRWTAKCK